MQAIRLALFAFAVSLFAGAAAAERLDEVLAEMDKAGKRLKTMTADFVQTDHDFLLKDQEETQGKLTLRDPRAHPLGACATPREGAPGERRSRSGL